MINKKTIAHFIMILIVTIIGINVFIEEMFLEAVTSPLQIIFLKAFFSFLLIQLFSIFIKTEKVESRDLIKLALCGLFGFAIYHLTYSNGLKYTNKLDADLISMGTPIMVFILAASFIRGNINLLKAIAIVFGAIGSVFLILYLNEVSIDAMAMRGDVLIIFHSFALASYYILVKPLILKYSPVTILKWVFLFGLLFVIPFSAGQMYYFDVQALNISTWIALVFVICGGFLIYLLSLFSLKELNIETVAYYIYLVPVIAFIISIFRSENNLLIKLLSVLLILIGLYLVSVNSKKKLKKMPEREKDPLK